MKVDLEYPYDKDWKHGYLVTNGENRKTVILYNSEKDRSSTAYARYLVSVVLGRYLTDDEHVDHIDNDKTNDDIENLQVITQQENSIKEAKRKGRILVELECPVCYTRFIRRRGITQVVQCNKDKIICCSKTCSDVHKTKKLSVSEKVVISRKSVIRIFRSHD